MNTFITEIIIPSAGASAMTSSSVKFICADLRSIKVIESAQICFEYLVFSRTVVELTKLKIPTLIDYVLIKALTQ